MTQLLWSLLMVTPATCLLIYGLLTSQQAREAAFAFIEIAALIGFCILTLFGIGGIIASAMGTTL